MGRTASLFVTASMVCLFSFGLVNGSELSVRLELDPSEVQFGEPEPGVVVVDVQGCPATGYLDYPALPYRIVSMLLPQGDEVASYRIEVAGRITLDHGIPLARFEGEYRDDGAKIGMFIPPDEAVGDDGVFPRWRVRHLGSHFYRGYRIAAFAVYPFRYHTDSGVLELESDLRLVIETGPAGAATDRMERIRHVDGFRDGNRRTVEAMVENPGQAAAYSFSDIIVDEGDRGFLPSYLPSMEGSEVSYLIITNEEMAPAFENLAQWKTMKGVPAVVRTVEWIGQNYRSGADLSESVRIFIQEAFAKWGVEWVVLGGDTDIIPARYGYVTFNEGDMIPADIYFSSLDGTWNDDGDSLWGEAYHNAQDPGDDADLYAEVYLGRIPVSGYSEAETFVAKTIAYAAPADTAAKEKFLFLAEVLFPYDYVPGDEIYIDGAEYSQGIYEPYLELNTDVVTSRLYESCALYPGSVCLTMASALDSLEAGANHVVHVGHGQRYNMSVGNGSILNYDADHLTNGDATYHMYLMNCANVAFDTECLAESFLLNGEGGAVAITGASRSAYPSVSRPYMDEYYNLLFEHEIVQLGRLQTMSRLPFTPIAFSESVDRWTHFIYTYLGDPELNIFSARAETFTVSVPPTAGYGENSITVQVQSGGSPYDSARVCLYKDGDDYAFDFTGPSGEVTFEKFLCRTGGDIVVTVTGRNHCRYEDTIQVLGEAGPYLRVEDRTIYDDVVGNGDGVLDSGEWVTLYVKLRNTGQGDGEKLYAKLRSADAPVTVTDSTAIYPDISSGGSAYGQDGFRFQVDSTCEDEEVVEFTIEIHDSTGGLWTETFACEVHAPEIELYVKMASDTLPYGNNNGVIEPGEDYLLYIGVKNFGTGTVYGLEGVFETLDFDFTVTDSLSVYGEIAPMEVGYGDGFVIAETNMTNVNFFTLTLTDAYGRVFTRRMELREPDPPYGLVLDSSYGPTEIHATWHSPFELERYRYNVYHAVQEGGPYERTSDDLVAYTLFHDYDLLTNTVYYYVVTTVDTCGNESAPSVEIWISTNPPQLPGWPNTVDRASSSSPKIADVDGDTYPDIVVGSNYIHAWHANGIELRDGDNQPVTLGIFNEFGDNYQSPPALADVDGVPGAEIIACSWGTKEVYVFAMDGDTLPGWPKSTADFCWAAPVVGDMDDDGDLEIIAYDVDGKVYMWHHDGTEVRDGDGNPGTDGVFFLTDYAGSGPWHISTPALADFDEDGVLEIIVFSPDTGSPGIQDSIYCLNGDGSHVAGWPIPIEDENTNVSASPAVGDIDGDGHLEVVVQSSCGRIYGLNHDGSWMSGWPQWIYSNVTPSGSPALADLTGDGTLEIVLPGMDSHCYIFRHNGQQLQNYNPAYDWPQAYASSGYTESSPTIADITGDGSYEIILGGQEGVLHAWNVYGEPVPGFPILVGSFLRGTPMVKDIDFDGDLELVTSAWDTKVYVWDLVAERYYGFAAWNGFHANVHNTGWIDYTGVTAAPGLACTFRLTGGTIELGWLIDGAGPANWSLYRSKNGDDFDLIAAGLTADGGGTIGFTDRSIEEGLVYRYRLEADGNPGLYVETEAIEVPVAGVRLYQNYPNPFNPATTIAFTVPGGSAVKRNVYLAVYDVRGTRIATLVNGALPGGRHEVLWEGKNDRGGPAASGVYFTRLSVDGREAMRKIVLMR